MIIIQHAVEAAWLAVEDLLQAHHPLDARHTALQFLTVLISSQVQPFEMSEIFLVNQGDFVSKETGSYINHI